jgi:hypothetical protein
MVVDPRTSLDDVEKRKSLFIPGIEFGTLYLNSKTEGNKRPLRTLCMAGRIILKCICTFQLQHGQMYIWLQCCGSQRQHLHQHDVEIHRTVGECVSVILTLKFDLLNYIKENVSSQLCVAEKTDSIFFPKSFKLLCLEARNRKKEACFAKLNFPFRRFSYYRSISSSWRLSVAFTTSKERTQASSWISFPKFLKSLDRLPNSSCSLLRLLVYLSIAAELTSVLRSSYNGTICKFVFL